MNVRSFSGLVLTSLLLANASWAGCYQGRVYLGGNQYVGPVNARVNRFLLLSPRASMDFTNTESGQSGSAKVSAGDTYNLGRVSVYIRDVVTEFGDYKHQYVEIEVCDR
jgi:hypothetical protein